MVSEEKADEILAIYHSLIGKDGCTWNYDYPSIVDVKNDISKKILISSFK